LLKFIDYLRVESLARKVDFDEDIEEKQNDGRKIKTDLSQKKSNKQNYR